LDKCLGPDNWTVEIFLHFFELMGQEFLDMVEESQNRQFISGSIKYNFITRPKGHLSGHFLRLQVDIFVQYHMQYYFKGDC